MSQPVKKIKSIVPAATGDYSGLVSGVSELVEAARCASVRTVNAFMTATYWEVGRRIVEFEQGGEKQAVYGESLLLRLAGDLTARFGKGFGKSNLFLMRKFYLASAQIFQTASGKLGDNSNAMPIFQTVSGISGGEKRATPSLELPSAKSCQTPPGESTDAICLPPSSISQTTSGKSSPFALTEPARAFPLPWSHYILLISRSRSPEAFAFYQTEALRGGWSVRQLQRQMDSQFYERTALSRNKAAMLAKGAKPQPGDAVSADEEIRHPLVLEFLGLRDEYSETGNTSPRCRMKKSSPPNWKKPANNLSHGNDWRMSFLDNFSIANQVGRVTPVRAVVARVAPIDLIKSSSIADGRIPSPLGGERVRVRGEITPVIDIKCLRFMERSLFPSDLLTAHEPGPAPGVDNRRRIILIVVAGILPAVEPGILPGGKTIRRRPPFSSPASRSSRKSCQNSGSVSAPPRDYPFPLSRISRISRFKFLVFRRLLCSMRSLRLSPIPMGLRPPARGCRASEATPGNPVHGPLQLQRSCALLPFSKPAEARKSKA